MRRVHMPMELYQYQIINIYTYICNRVTEGVGIGQPSEEIRKDFSSFRASTDDGWLLTRCLFVSSPLFHPECSGHYQRLFNCFRADNYLTRRIGEWFVCHPFLTHWNKTSEDIILINKFPLFQTFRESAILNWLYFIFWCRINKSDRTLHNCWSGAIFHTIPNSREHPLLKPLILICLPWLLNSLLYVPIYIFQSLTLSILVDKLVIVNSSSSSDEKNSKFLTFPEGRFSKLFL